MPVYYIILNYKYLSRTDKDGTVFKQIVLRFSISANGFFKSLIVIYLIKEMILNLKLLIILV